MGLSVCVCVHIDKKPTRGMDSNEWNYATLWYYRHGIVVSLVLDNIVSKLDCKRRKGEGKESSLL